jgi:hypothetical protein
MNRIVFQREVNNFDQKVNDFVAKYSSPVKHIAERVLKEADRLALHKDSLSTRCNALSFSLQDNRLFQSKLLASQSKVDEVVSKLNSKTQHLNLSQEVSELCKVGELEKRCELLKAETSYFLRSPGCNLDSKEARALKGYWNDFIDQIRSLNSKAGDYIFKKMESASDRQQALETPECKRILKAEELRIHLWIEADFELLKLRGDRAQSLPNSRA